MTPSEYADTLEILAVRFAKMKEDLAHYERRCRDLTLMNRDDCNTIMNQKAYITRLKNQIAKLKGEPNPAPDTEAQAETR